VGTPIFGRAGTSRKLTSYHAAVGLVTLAAEERSQVATAVDRERAQQPPTDLPPAPGRLRIGGTTPARPLSPGAPKGSNTRAPDARATFWCVAHLDLDRTDAITSGMIDQMRRSELCG
jgi:hypothetical protein